MGEEVLSALSPTQQVMKIVRDEVVVSALHWLARCSVSASIDGVKK